MKKLKSIIMPLFLCLYKTLYEENSDLIGWIKIEDTPLDYPVMQNMEDNEYYLHRNYQESEYQIVAVILSKVYMKSDVVFKFYQFVQADSEAEFDEYILNMKKLSLYDTEISASYGDQLLTLVTCNYHTENGRLAVLAKKMKD